MSVKCNNGPNAHWIARGVGAGGGSGEGCP